MLMLGVKRVNLGWSKSMIVITTTLVLKPNLMVNPRQGLGHELVGSTSILISGLRFTQGRSRSLVGSVNPSWTKLKKSKQPCSNKKNQQIFTCVLSRVYKIESLLGFLIE